MVGIEMLQWQRNKVVNVPSINMNCAKSVHLLSFLDRGVRMTLLLHCWMNIHSLRLFLLTNNNPPFILRQRIVWTIRIKSCKTKPNMNDKTLIRPDWPLEISNIWPLTWLACFHNASVLQPNQLFFISLIGYWVHSKSISFIYHTSGH